MSKNIAKFNYWVDIFFMITLVVVILTGIVIWGWGHPEGMRPGMGFGMPPQEGASEVVQRDRNADEQTPPVLDASPSKGETTQADASPADVSDGFEHQGEAPNNAPSVASRGGDARQGGGRPMMGDSKILWGLFKGKSFLGMTKRGWNNVHAWVSMAMILFFILHLKTHFRWLVVMSKKVGKDDATEKGNNAPTEG